MLLTGVFAIAGVASGCLSEVTTRPLGNSRNQALIPGDPAMPGPSPLPSPEVIDGNALPQGAVGAVSMSSGALNGWARDTDTPSQSMYVELYVDGPAGTGTFAGTVLASQNRTLFPAGPYGFSFTLPTQFQDGKLHRLYAYGIDSVSSARGALGSPIAFSAGLNASGMDYYNNTVSSSVQSSCAGCHSGMNTYENLKTLMMQPSKFDGGTATSNYLYDRARGVNHGGGTRCNAGTAPCNLFQTWWGLEFN